MVNTEVVRVRIRSLELAGAWSATMAALATLGTRTRRAYRSTWCALTGGHYRVLHAEPERLALKCVSCGHTTRGWDIPVRHRRAGR